MAYKRYIKRGDKVYGPYVYESKRVGDKVLGSYVGNASANRNNKVKKINKFNFSFNRKAIKLVFILPFLFLLIFSMSFLNNQYHIFSTGRVTLQSQPVYSINETISGSLKINLKPGELIPADSLVYVRLGSQEKILLLSQLLSISTVSDDFFVENVEIGGSGEGYGFEGERKIYPNVSFEFYVYQAGGEVAESENVTEPLNESVSEEVPPSVPEDYDSEAPAEEIPAEEIPSEEAPAEEPAEEVPAEETKEAEKQAKEEEKSEAKAEKNEVKDEKKSKDVSDEGASESGSESGGEETSESSGDSGTSESNSDGGEASITGGVIRGFRSFTGKVIGLLIRPLISESQISGRTISETQIISAVVSFENNYEYELQEGQTVEIVDGSIESGLGSLGSDAVILEISSSRAVFSTEYYESLYGFGEEYLVDETETLSIPLENFGIVAEVGKLHISLDYNNKSIVYSETEITAVGASSEDYASEVAGSANITTNLTFSDITEINITSNISIKHLTNIPDLNIMKNSFASLNLSNYFSSQYDISYSALETENISIVIVDDTATITPDTDFSGSAVSRFSVSVGNESLDSNIFSIIVSEGNISIITLQFDAVIGQQVRWKKSIILENPENISIQLPKIAANVSVKKVIEGVSEEAVSSTNLTAITGMVSLEIETKKKGLIPRFFSFLNGAITGRVVEEVSEAEISDSAEVVEVSIEDNATEYEIEYYTEAPVAFVENLSNYHKIVTVSGPDELVYENVLTFTEVPEIIRAGNEAVIKVYWLYDSNGSVARLEHNFSAYDRDSNGFIDYVYWIAPHLSNESFEVSISILNIQSYPMVGGNWSVMFNTTGEADLKIYASNGTTWTNYSDIGYDLRFLEVKCGPEILNYTWVSETPECLSDSCYVLVSNYSCNETGNETSFVISGGKHTKKFDFGGQVAYAYNAAGGIPDLLLVSPTLADNTNTSGTIYINISITKGTNSIEDINYTWNNANYSFYSDSLIRMYTMYSSLLATVDDSQLGQNLSCTHINYCPTFTTGKYNGALDFQQDTSNDFLAIPQITLADNTPWTIQYWFYQDTDNGMPIGDRSDNNNRFYHVLSGDSYLLNFHSNSGLSASFNFGADPKGAWKHVIVTCNGATTATCYFYLNGALINSTMGIVDTSFLIDGLGKAYTNDNYNWDGKLDEVRIYTRYMGATEALKNYRFSLAKLSATSWNLYAYEGTATTNTYTFQGCASDNLGNINCSGIRTINPVYVSWDSPVSNKVYFNNTVEIEITNASNSRYVWWYNGTSNLSYVNPTLLTLDDGSYTLFAYANDSLRLDYSNSISFSIANDSSIPGINISSPFNTTYSVSKINFNVSGSENLSFCKFSLDNFLNNFTMAKLNATYFSYTNESMLGAQYIASFWCNDSAGNINSTEGVTFFVGASDVNPQVAFISPTPADEIITSSASQDMRSGITKATYGIANINWSWDGGGYSFYDDSLVLMLNLDNNTEIGDNSTKAVDSSKYGNNGNINGASWNASGKYSKAMSFDGIDDSVNFSDSNSLRFKSSFSIEVWIKPFTELDSQPSWFSIVSKVNSTTPRSGYFLGGDGIASGNGKLACGFYNISGDVRNIWPVNLNPAAKNEWSHVVCTYDYDTGFI
ncbi:MAG: LamG domain-containing protein, partial [archaeon]